MTYQQNPIDAKILEVASEAVDRGAALLDEKVPGWEAKIDLGTLNLESTCLCVLGQIYHEAAMEYFRDPRDFPVQDFMINGYIVGVTKLGLSIGTMSDGSRVSAGSYGFSYRPGVFTLEERNEAPVENLYFQALNDLWAVAVLERRFPVEIVEDTHFGDKTEARELTPA